MGPSAQTPTRVALLKSGAFCTKNTEILMFLPIHYQSWYFEPKSQCEFPNSYHGYLGIITCQKTFLLLKFIISQPISGRVKILSWAQSCIHRGHFEGLFLFSWFIPIAEIKIPILTYDVKCISAVCQICNMNLIGQVVCPGQGFTFGQSPAE